MDLPEPVGTLLFQHVVITVAYCVACYVFRLLILLKPSLRSFLYGSSAICAGASWLTEWLECFSWFSHK